MISRQRGGGAADAVQSISDKNYAGLDGAPMTNLSIEGCYAPVIMNAVNKMADCEQLQVTELPSRSLEELCSAYIDNDIPVILGNGQYGAKIYFKSARKNMRI